MADGLRPAIFGDEIVGFHHDLIRLRNGSTRAVVATSSLNFFALPEEGQTRTVQAFRELLHGQTGPLQLYVRIRRVQPDPADLEEPNPATAADRRAFLNAMTRGFIAAHLEDVPVFSRTVFVVLAPLAQPRRLLRTWVHRFDSRTDNPSVTVLDRDVPMTQRVETLIEHLRLMGIHGRRLRAEELEALFDDLSARSPTAQGRVTFQHRIGGVDVQGRSYATVIVERYPGEEVTAGWLLPLLDFKGELHVAIHILPIETDRMLGLLRHKIRDLRADQIAGAEAAAIEASTLGTLPDAVHMHHALARNEEKSFALSLYLTVGAESPAALRTQVAALEACCRPMMLGVGQPFFQMRHGLLSSWPFGIDALGREHLVHTSAATTFLPWLHEDLADRDGHYWGYNKETGGLVVFDPFDESRFPNANIAVVAHSGAGKSYAAGSLLLSGYTRGVGAIVLDPEAEYGGLIQALGGAYLSLAAGSGHAINALEPLLYADDEGALDQLSDVIDLVAVMCGGLDAVERAQLEMAIRSVIGAATRVPTLADVATILGHEHPGSRVATVLQRWVTGELGRLFGAPTNVDLGADVVGFNLRDLKDEVIPPASLLLANWLWSALRRDRRRRHLVIDEAGLLLEHEPIRRFLVRLARRIRKYQGSLMLVSQNPGDFFETKDGAVLATNPSILLLGSQKHSEAVKLQRAFNLTDRQVGYLETAQRGDFLLIAGANRLPLHVMAPPWMDELIVRSHRPASSTT